MKYTPGDLVAYKPHHQPRAPASTWDEKPWTVEEVVLTLRRGRSPTVFYGLAQYNADGRIIVYDALVRDDQLCPWEKRPRQEASHATL